MTIVRTAAVSFGMTAPGDWDAFAAAAQDVAERAAAAGVRLLVLPEYASLGLEFTEPPRSAAFYRRTATDVPELLAALAKRHGLWLFGGTHRRTAGGGAPADAITNDGLLFGPRGETWVQQKLRCVPSELDIPDPVSSGPGFTVLETDVGALAILICYDVEFPEHARLLAQHGAEILLVPSWTETVAGFWRVRHCAHARCVEDHVYAVHAPLVGSLEPFGIDERAVGSAAILAPADPLVSATGVLAEGPWCSAGHMAIADLDLALLRRIRAEGAVRTLADHLTPKPFTVSVVRL